MTKKRQERPQDLEIDKLPPQAPDIEKAVLGASLMEREAVESILNLLEADYFYLLQHQLIFQSIKNLHEKNKPVDILTVCEELKSMGELENAGGKMYVIQLTNDIATADNIEPHSRYIIENFIKRELIRAASTQIQESYSPAADPFQLIMESVQRIEKIESRTVKGAYNTPKKMIKSMVEDLHTRMKGEATKRSVNSSIQSVQYRTNGWYGSDFIVIAGRPGMGKTAFVLSEIYAMANAGIPVAIFSMEMSAMQLMYRIASMITGINSEVLTKGQPNDEEFKKFSQCLGAIESLPIYIDDTPNKNIYDIRSESRQLVKKSKVRMIFVDYLQLCTAYSDGKGKMNNREAEVSTISRMCKLIAKENDIPVMALSQLSRDVEKRSGKIGRPQLSDLRESGAIEQDADIVGFVYRESVYNREAKEDEALLIFEKNRSGKLGDCPMRWIADKTQFVNAPFYKSKSTSESSKSESEAKNEDDLPF